jgi:predicted phosphodiesterase
MILDPIKDLGELTGPLLIFGGPYSNLQASEAMLQVQHELGIDPGHTICTGDTVAYGAQPEETSRLIRESGIHVVMGNCEESLAENRDDCGCGFQEGMACATLSDDWYRYAQARISDASRQWMGSLPRIIHFTLGGKRCAIIHGGIGQINEFIFASTPSKRKEAQLQTLGMDIIIGGHCGIPFADRLDSGTWLNAGVIGLPANDGNRDGWYLLLTPQTSGIHAEWRRLSYDAIACHEVMVNTEQQAYADTILSGRWPSMDILPAQEQQLQGQNLHLPSLVL